MKTITVSNGDIQLNSGKIQFSTGQNKLIEDLQRWLEEPIGTGFTTPNFGSLLSTYIGSNSFGLSTNSVDNEILRVLQLYQGQQMLELKSAQNAAMLSNWNKSEIIQNIVSIESVVQGTSIISNIYINTLDNVTVSLNIYLGNDGIKVQNG
jgi:hypothetical protein